MVPTALQTEVLLETSRSGGFGRRQLASRLGRALGQDVAVGAAATAPRYAVRITRRANLTDLAAVASITDRDAARLAEAKGLPPAPVGSVQGTIARAAAAGDEATFARELTSLAATGAVGLRAVAALADAPIREVSVSNEGHDLLLRDFLKAETYLAGATQPEHAHSAAKRLTKLGERIAEAIAEIKADGIIGLVSHTEAQDRGRFLAAVAKEAAALEGYALGALGIAKT